MDERSRVLLTSLLGAALGAVVGYLYMTKNGQRVREQIEPALDAIGSELQRARHVGDKVRKVAREGEQTLNSLVGEGRARTAWDASPPPPSRQVSAAGPSPGAASYRARRGMQRLGRAVRRHASHSARAAWMALRRLGVSDDLTFASSIAYYALLSFFPLLLLVFSLLGRLTGDPADRAALVALLAVDLALR